MPDMKSPLTLVCPSCHSVDHEKLDIFTCSWCGSHMVERMRLPDDEQELAWTQLALC